MLDVALLAFVAGLCVGLSWGYRTTKEEDEALRPLKGILEGQEGQEGQEGGKREHGVISGRWCEHGVISGRWCEQCFRLSRRERYS